MRWPASWGVPGSRELPPSDVNCLIVDQSPTKVPGIAVISIQDAPATVVKSPKWPQVRMSRSGGEASAGPTGMPWLDSNGYEVQVARALHPDRPVWLDYGPKSATAPSENAVRLAISEACAYGGRWVIRPDLGPWPAIEQTVDFFARHKSWQAYRPLARLAVVSDFAGPNRALAAESLNLLTRRQVPFLVVPVSSLAHTELKAFSAVLCVDKVLPEPLAQYKGLVIRPKTDDPYQIAVDTHMQLSRKNDMLRLWNAGSLNALYTGSPDGRTQLVQLLNYAANNRSADLTLGLARPYRSARLHTMDRPEAMDLPITHVRAGVELQLPPFPVYAAIELGE